MNFNYQWEEPERMPPKQFFDLKRLTREKGIDRETVERWLEKNPPPEDYTGTRYSWAHLEMPIPRGILGNVFYWFSLV